MKNELKIVVNKNAVHERYLGLFKNMKNGKDTQIVPVIKNNCNGLGTEALYDLFAEMPECNMVACSYANEFYLKLRNDERLEKMAWIWRPDPKYLEVKGLVLVCKEWDQLDFCLENGITFYVEVNVCMNRGGFLASDLPALAEKLKDRKVNVFTHCPWEDYEGISQYHRHVRALKKEIYDSGLDIGLMSCENSAVFNEMNVKNREHYDVARVGELLLLPRPAGDVRGQREDVGYEPVVWETHVAHLLQVQRGEWVGYRAVQLDHSANLAVLPVGYYHLEVDKLKYVKVNGVMCNVITSMHDTTIVELPENLQVNIEDTVTLMDAELVNKNWNRCRQKTCKINPDLAEYEYREV